MQKFMYDVFNNGVASSAVAMLEIDRRLGSNDILTKAVLNGLAQTTSEKIVEWFQGKKVSDMVLDPYLLADDVAFNTLIYSLLDMYGIGQPLMDFVNQLQIPQRLKEVLIRGVISASTKTLYETLNGMDSVRYHQLFRYVLHPSDLVRQL